MTHSCDWCGAPATVTAGSVKSAYTLHACAAHGAQLDAAFQLFNDAAYEAAVSS